MDDLKKIFLYFPDVLHWPCDFKTREKVLWKLSSFTSLWADVQALCTQVNTWTCEVFHTFLLIHSCCPSLQVKRQLLPCRSWSAWSTNPARLQWPACWCWFPPENWASRCTPSSSSWPSSAASPPAWLWVSVWLRAVCPRKADTGRMDVCHREGWRVQEDLHGADDVSTVESEGDGEGGTLQNGTSEYWEHFFSSYSTNLGYNFCLARILNQILIGAGFFWWCYMIVTQPSFYPLYAVGSHRWFRKIIGFTAASLSPWMVDSFYSVAPFIPQCLCVILFFWFLHLVQLELTNPSLPVSCKIHAGGASTGLVLCLLLCICRETWRVAGLSPSR